MTGDVAPVILRADDAIELVEILEFLGDFFDSASDTLEEPLARFTGGGLDLGEMRADLARFAFLLGGDGERFLGGGTP